jgi:hypothetical protein
MTEKLHFDDLTQITAPFGLLDDDTQARLRAWPHGWEFVSFDKMGWGEAEGPIWAFTATYRAKPAPLTQDVYPWGQIPKGMDWAARDESGFAFTYACVPVAGKLQWCSSGGDFARIDNCHVGYQRGTCDWRDSLQQRPDGM